LIGYRGPVQPAWIDENDHVDTMYYKEIADRSVVALFRRMGITSDYRTRMRATFFQAEMHICYERKLRLGDEVEVRSWVIGVDSKRIHQLHEIYRTADGVRAATVELMTLHVSEETRRVSPFPTPSFQTSRPSPMHVQRFPNRPRLVAGSA
jgi:acyl-CoA thioesterase FadM